MKCSLFWNIDHRYFIHSFMLYTHLCKCTISRTLQESTSVVFALFFFFSFLFWRLSWFFPFNFFLFLLILSSSFLLFSSKSGSCDWYKRRLGQIKKYMVNSYAFIYVLLYLFNIWRKWKNKTEPQASKSFCKYFKILSSNLDKKATSIYIFLIIYNLFW